MPSLAERGIGQSPTEVLGNQSNYEYFPQGNILSFPPSVSDYIAGMHLDRVKNLAVSVVEVPESIAEGHFGVVRGVDMLHLMVATGVIGLDLKAGENGKKSPSVVGVENVRFSGLILPPYTFNVVVDFSDPEKLSAAILSGGEVVASVDRIHLTSDPLPEFTGGEFIPGQNERAPRDIAYAFLEKMGYGPSKMRLHSADSETRDGKGVAVGALESTLELPFSFYEGLEALAQLCLWRAKGRGDIREDTSPLFAGIPSASMSSAVGVPSRLSMEAWLGERERNIFRGSGRIFLGENKIMEARIEGATVATIILDRRMKRETLRKQAANPTPLFPKQ